MRSSYITNNYGKLLSEYVFSGTWQPRNIVELGVLDGYSTLYIAKGIEKCQKLRGFAPQFDAYDLFDDYAYKHGEIDKVQKLLDDNNVGHLVNLQKGNAFEVYQNYPDIVYDKDGTPGLGIEMLHIDISNNGKNLRELFNLWHPKIGRRGLVFIEGGSEERDEVEWMKSYNFESLKKEIDTNPLINKYYMYGTYYRFPSMTLLLRKWWNVK